MTRTGNANATMLMVMLMVLTVVLGALAWIHYDAVQIHIEGRPESRLNIRPENSLSRIQQNIRQLDDELEALEHERDSLSLQLGSIGAELARSGFYLRDGTWVGITGDGTGFESGWTHTRKMIAFDHEELLTWDQGYANPERHSFRSLNDAINHARRAIERIGDQIAEEEETFNRTRDRLLTEQDNLRDRREQHHRESRTRYAELSNRKSRLETRIRDLLELRLEWLTEIDADGEVLSLTNNAQYVVINLGADDGVIPGTRFEIFSLVHGRHITKGLCEVIDPNANVSTARVIETTGDRQQPLAVGDSIGNPIFNRGRQPTFVLAGEFRNYNSDDLAKFIERAGGIVRSALNPSVDYLVAGERSDAEQDAAREYRVLGMREDQLLRYLDTTFRPR